MLERVKYQNHMNEVIEFGVNGIFVNASDLHDYQWTATKKNDKITHLARKVGTRKIPIQIICDTEAEGIAARNKLHEVAEKDVLAMKPGRLIIGDYYLKCYITKSQKKKYLISKRMMNLTLTLTSDDMAWYREQSSGFQGHNAETKSETVVAQCPTGLPGIPVDSDGNYTDENGQQWICDEVDFARGVYVQRIGKYTITGDVIWNPHGGSGNGYDQGYYAFVPIGQMQIGDGKNGLFSMFNRGTLYENNNAFVGGDTIQLKHQGVADENELKAFFAENPCDVLYAVATPTETALSAEELAAYAALQTYSPKTSITNDAGAFMSAAYTTTDGEAQEISGTKITMNDSADAKLSGLTIYGRTTQDGTPSPENPVDLVSAGQSGTISIAVVGVQSFGLDHPFDYPFEWYQSMQSQTLNNTGFVASNFRLIIYGACVNPSISINGHEYQVECAVNSGEYLTIDSVTKKIFLTSVDGTTTNKFNNRNRDSYIFEKIQPGGNSVAWDGTFGFDVILLEERSEPKWT